MVTYEDVAAAHERIKGAARRTPVLTSATVDARIGAKVFFKCENFQRMGAFKFRGAYNALSQLDAKGVLAFSSGNHAQAVALSGKLLGIRTVIVMPWNAPSVKLEATRGYGAEVVTYGPTDDRAAKELIEETGPLDALLVPCGGGGLLSGCAIAARELSPSCKVIGVEPAAGDDATRSFHEKKLIRIPVPDTIADGARTTSLGSLTFPLVLRYVDEMLTVTDAELLAAMFFLWERMKIVVEPTGALAFAALFHKKFSRPGKIGVVISGGNVDLHWAAAQLNQR